MILINNKSQDIVSLDASNWQDVFGRRSHALWEALHFIKENPGCRQNQLKAHLERAYPHGSRNVFNWVVSGGYRSNRNQMERLHLYAVSQRRFHILPVGAAIADQPKPAHTPAKPQTTPASWFLDHSPERGKMLLARRRFMGFEITDAAETGGPVDAGNYTYVEKDEICIFLCEWKRETTHNGMPLRISPRWSGPSSLRRHGVDRSDCYVAVIAGNRSIICAAGELRSADRLPRKKKSKEVSNANQ
jgi:hypothetical protein